MELDVMDLPLLNSVLNGTAATLLIIGYVLIRQGRWKAHRGVMIAAFSTSVLFLISYITYHVLRGGVSTPLGTDDAMTLTIYRFILFTHIILAAIVPFMASITLFRGLKRNYPKHKALARWTLPIWLYVSVTGVLVYLMLYVWYPSAAVAR